MAKQSYPDIKVPAGTKTTLAQLFADAGLTAPTGEVSVEIQNITDNGVVYLTFGNQTGLDSILGSPIPAFWTREELEDFNNIFVRTASDNVFIGVMVNA